MPKCIAFVWDDDTPCRNKATHLMGSDGELKYCGDHYANLISWSQVDPYDSQVRVKNQRGNLEEVCLSNDGYQEKAVWCKDIKSGLYPPGSPLFQRSSRPYSPGRTPISLMGSPGSPRRGLITSYNSPVVKPGSPTAGKIQQYLQKPSSPRAILQATHPISAQPGEPANIQLQPGETGKKKKSDETMTGHECSEDGEEKFVEGREPRGARLIRAAPDIKLECNPPYINFLNNEGIVNAMEILDRTKDAKEGLEQIAIIKETVKRDPKNKGYNYNVTEGVVDKVAAAFARYMFDADRIELLLTFMFYYDSRDLSQSLSFYGFKTGSVPAFNNAPIFLPNESLIKILNAAPNQCQYPVRPQEIPDIRRNMYQTMGDSRRADSGDGRTPRSGGGEGGDGGPATDEQRSKFESLKADFENLSPDKKSNRIQGIFDSIKKFLEKGTAFRERGVTLAGKLTELETAINTAKNPSGAGRSSLDTRTASGAQPAGAPVLGQGNKNLRDLTSTSVNYSLVELNKLKNKLSSLIGTSSIKDDWHKTLFNTIFSQTTLNDDQKKAINDFVNSNDAVKAIGPLKTAFQSAGDR